MQIVKNRHCLFKYKSEIWNQIERKYNATKREYRAILKIFKKFRFWLYEIYFFLETNTNVLAA
jgi:hypothetical protein